MDDARRNLQDNIRNSLNAINSVSEALIVRSQKSPGIKPYVERIRCQVSKLKSYVDDMQKHMVMEEANESFHHLPKRRHKPQKK